MAWPFCAESANQPLLAQMLASRWSMSGWLDGCRQTFFKSLPVLQFLSNSHETWHTCSMCRYAHNYGTNFRNFDFKIFG